MRWERGDELRFYVILLPSEAQECSMFEDLLQGTAALTIGIIVISCLCVFGVIAFSYLLYFIFARSKRKKAEALLETGSDHIGRFFTAQFDFNHNTDRFQSK